jgi:hypothetical protein
LFKGKVEGGQASKKGIKKALGHLMLETCMVRKGRLFS